MAWSKESRHKRGYGAAWDKKRKRVLERDGGLCRCAHCAKSGRIRIATEVDHVINKAKGREMGWTEAGRIPGYALDAQGVPHGTTLFWKAL